jgi:hypothetical protein
MVEHFEAGVTLASRVGHDRPVIIAPISAPSVFSDASLALERSEDRST